MHPRRVNAKDMITSKQGENFTFPIADGTATLLGRDHEIQESTLRQSQLAGSEDVREQLQTNSDGSQTAESKDDAETRNDFWSIQVDFIYRHHNEPRVQLCVSKEGTFPIPLKYIDVTRATCTNLEVLQEKTYR